MQRILIVGAGGHAQVVADILLQAAGAGAPVGFLDDNPASHRRALLGLPVLGAVADLARIPHDALVIAIGSNRARAALYGRLCAQGERFVPAVHPRAIIAPGVPVGAGAVVCAGAIVGTGSRVGANAILNTGCTVDHHNVIGDHAHVAPGVHLAGEVQVGEGAFIGIGAAVLPGRRVGAWSTVGAAALVRHDVPERATVVGVPARILRS